MKIINTNIHIDENDPELLRVKKMYGHTHTIEALPGTEVNFSELSADQSVCWGDGLCYHFRLTKKPH